MSIKEYSFVRTRRRRLANIPSSRTPPEHRESERRSSPEAARARGLLRAGLSGAERRYNPCARANRTDRTRRSFVDGGAGGDANSPPARWGSKGRADFSPLRLHARIAWCGSRGGIRLLGRGFRGAKALTRIQPAHGWSLGTSLGWQGAGTRLPHGGTRGRSKSHPVAMKRRTFHWRRQGSMPTDAPWLGDATGARSGPLAKMARYYRAHLAISPMSVRVRELGERLRLFGLALALGCCPSKEGQLPVR